jgi:hypothetical protein
MRSLISSLTNRTSKSLQKRDVDKFVVCIDGVCLFSFDDLLELSKISTRFSDSSQFSSKSFVLDKFNGLTSELV